MDKDDRIYAKFTLDFPTHPKIAPLSDAAFRALIEMVLWSRTHLTDGWIPSEMIVDDNDAKQTRSSCFWSACVCFELAHNSESNPSLISCEKGGYILHDFAKHQTEKADIEAKREAKKRAGQLGGLASGRSRREAAAKQQRSKPLKQTRSKTKPETETYKYLTPTGLGTTADACAPNGARTTANCTRCDSDGRVELEPGITARCTHPEGALRET